MFSGFIFLRSTQCAGTQSYSIGLTKAIYFLRKYLSNAISTLFTFLPVNTRGYADYQIVNQSSCNSLGRTFAPEMHDISFRIVLHAGNWNVLQGSPMVTALW